MTLKPFAKWHQPLKLKTPAQFIQYTYIRLCKWRKCAYMNIYILYYGDLIGQCCTTVSFPLKRTMLQIEQQ